MKRPLQPGDRVRVYGSIQLTDSKYGHNGKSWRNVPFVCRITEALENNWYYAKNKSTGKVFVHHKQCRRLVPKRKEPEHRHEWSHPYDRTAYSERPCPRKDCRFGKYIAVPDHATGRKSEPVCKKCEWAMSDCSCKSQHSHRPDMEKQLAGARENAEKARERAKPEPRRWWISSPNAPRRVMGDPFRYWETTISDDPTDHDREKGWIPVQEVLPEEK